MKFDGGLSGVEEHQFGTCSAVYGASSHLTDAGLWVPDARRLNSERATQEFLFRPR